MRWFLILVVSVGILACKKSAQAPAEESETAGSETKKITISAALKEAQEAPVKYTKGLQKSLGKTQSVADKVNAAQKKSQDEMNKAMEGM